MRESAIYYDKTFQEYRAIKALNCTKMKRFAISPAEVKDFRSLKKSEKVIRGSAVDYALSYGIDRFYEKYCTLPPNIKVRRGKKYEAFVEECIANDKEVLPRSIFNEVPIMYESVMSYPPAARLFEEARTQVTVVWEHETGILCKSLLDLYYEPDDPCFSAFVTDIKCTDSVQKPAFSKVISALKYHWQAYWYCRGISEITGFSMDSIDFSFITIQDHKPYSVEVFRLARGALELAEMEVEPLVRRYFECQETDHWPKSSGLVQEIDLPLWEYQKE